MTRFSVQDSAETILDFLTAEGYAIIEGVVTAEQMSRLQNEIQPHLDAAFSDANDALGSGAISFLPSLLAKAPAAGDILVHPLVNEVVEGVLVQTSQSWAGDTRVEMKTNVGLSDAAVITVSPGAKAQALHRDDIGHHRVHPGPESQVTAMFAISRFTEANGATRLIPRSHLWGPDRAPTPEETIGVEMESGSVLLWLGGLYHGGGNHTSTAPRHGMVIVYAHAHLVQVENMWLAVPIDVVRTLSPQVQKMLGWDGCEPYLGHLAFSKPRVLLEEIKDEGGSEDKFRGLVTTS